MRVDNVFQPITYFDLKVRYVAFVLILTGNQCHRCRPIYDDGIQPYNVLDYHNIELKVDEDMYVKVAYM